MGAHPLWLTEWLCDRVRLEPGMRVLDLGCGTAKSSIFLAREFDVEVWATDLWTSASENALRIADAGLEKKVFPIHASTSRDPRSHVATPRRKEGRGRLASTLRARPIDYTPHPILRD